MPGEWSEDVLAEFGDLEVTDESGDDNDEEDDDDVVDEIDLDSDDDEIDLDEIDLDEEREDVDDKASKMTARTGKDKRSRNEKRKKKIIMIPKDDWVDEIDGAIYELQSDPDNPDYTKQKELVEATLERQKSLQFAMENMIEDQAELMEKLPFLKDVEARAKDLEITEKDMEAISNTEELEAAVDNLSDLGRDEPLPPLDSDEAHALEKSTGVTVGDLEEFDSTYKELRDTLDEEPWDEIAVKDKTGWDGLDEDTLEEISDCLDALGGSSYNATKWMLYDLDFNVSNLLLAAVKHNPDAPIILHHWYPQLITCKRYEHVRERNFDFNWNDVENADIAELERYYHGFGYDEIPNKAPSETGIISLEDLDEEEAKMAAFEEWIGEVYNVEWDLKDFDDDDIRDEDNVFSEYFELPQHPDYPPIEECAEDVVYLDGEPENRSYRDRAIQMTDYEVIQDEEFQKEFRGHLVIACTSLDSDLEIAEKITKRFQEEFGKRVWVETRVEAIALEEDNVFEVWLESYDIDLLHSKRRANSFNEDWTGPAEVDDAQIEYLVDQVGYLISDTARNSYVWEFETID